MQLKPLPEGHHFSQTSLQDWLQCRRRFQYLYIRQMPYPAPVTADQIKYERHAEMGDTFHRLVHRHLVGIDATVLAAHIHDEQVRDWWQAYLMHGLTGLPTQRHAEVQLSAPLGGHRLLAKYDLIAADPGDRLIIVDWKTALKRPSRATLERRMQTVVYRYLLVEAGAYYNGGQPITPEQVEMIYWFTNYPTQPERLPYSTAQYHADRALLENLIREVSAERLFPKVAEADKDRVCRYCNFRSLCWDNVLAGAFADMFEVDDEPVPTDPGFDIDIDQIAEIEF